MLENISQQQLALRNADYQMPSQVAEANKLITDLNNQNTKVVNLMNEKWEELNEEIKEYPDLDGLINKSKRNYGYIPILTNNFKNIIKHSIIICRSN